MGRRWFQLVLLAVLARGGDAIVPPPLSAQRQPTPGPPLCPGPDSLGLRLTFFDVGQGDAALIVTPERRRVLIDGGRNRSAIARLLTERGVDSLDLIVASHNHADHIGGLPTVLSTLPVANLLENGLPATTSIYRSFTRAATASGVRVLGASSRTLSVGSAQFRVLSMDVNEFSQNLRSVGVIVSYGAFRAIFTGDAEVHTLTRWLATDSIPRVDVVKVGHHGSSNGTSPAWVSATSPGLAIISVSATNSYGHPTSQTLQRWSAPGRLILRTDEVGTIDVRGCRDGTFATATSRVSAP